MYMYIHMYICTYVSVCLLIYVYMYMYMHTYVRISPSGFCGVGLRFLFQRPRFRGSRAAFRGFLSFEPHSHHHRARSDAWSKLRLKECYSNGILTDGLLDCISAV